MVARAVRESRRDVEKQDRDTAREAVGIIWIGLEALGVPYEWTLPLSRWVYGTAANSGAN